MDIQDIFELLGTVFFSISGTLVAAKKTEIDWFGAIMISFVTALGGGTMRDLFLDSYPLVWIKNYNLIYAVVLGIILTKFFYKFFSRLRAEFLLFDTLGLAFFTIIGVEKALYFGVAGIIAVMMGVFTGVMGGVLRDLFTREIPVIFQKEIYATASIIGALVYLILAYFGCPRNINFLVSGGIIVIVRILSVRYNWHFPRFIKDDY